MKISPALQDLLRHDVHQYVMERMTYRQMILRHSQDFITIGYATPSQITLTRQPDGTIQTEPFPPQAVPFASHSGNLLKLAWSSNLMGAEKLVAQRLHQLRPKTEGQKVHHHQGPLWDITDTDLLKLAAKAAYQACATLINGAHPRNITNLGLAIIQDFIGKETAKKVIRIAGLKATIGDFNIYLTNTQACEDAHSCNPNATLLYFHSLTQDPQQAAQASHDTPQQILYTAERIFHSQPVKSSTAWETFNAIATKGLHSHTLDSPTRILNVHALCNAIESAGVQPPPTTVNALMANDAAILHRDPQLAALLIQEASKPEPQRSSSIRKINKTARALSQFTTKYTVTVQLGPQADHQPAIDTDPITELRDRLRSHPDTVTWQDAEQALDSAMKLPGISPKNRSIATDRTQAKRPKMPKERKLPAPELTEDQLAEATANPPRIEATDHAVRLIHADNVLMAVIKEADGTLRGACNTNWTDRWLVPPRGTTPEQNSASPQMPSTMGMVLAAYSGSASPHEQGPDTVRNQLAAHLARKRAQGTPIPDDQTLTAQLREAIAEITDPATWETAQRLALQPTFQDYNNAALGGHHLTQLMERTPGAAAWLMAHTDLDQKAQHPGQVVTLAKDHAASVGLTGPGWKTLCRTSAQTISEMTGDTFPVNFVATYLNACATATTAPSLEGLRLTALMTTRYLMEPEQGEAHPAANNVQRATNLLNRHIALTGQTPPRIRDIADYLRHLNTERNPLRATTWNGLQKASDRWHREMREARIAQDWQRIIQKQDGQIRAWNSLMGTTECQRHTFVPVTDQSQLMAEATAMLHCVLGYGDKCADGDSRIFSILKDGKHKGTLEIHKNSVRWNVAQARGLHNHPLDPETDRAAEALAQAYTLAWQSNPNSHESWQTPAPPGQNPKMMVETTHP